jgi:hypothetical protein
MYGLATIRRMNEEAGERAREEGIEPFLLEDASELDGMPPFPFPNVGDGADDLDERLERVDSLFCDSSGFGSPGEPALTVPQLLERLHDLFEEHGPLYVAIESVGQFQIYLGVWK